ncbi:four-carbon acid sugar kinase family protein [Jannaschia sp. S6380]|uniref:3-oxo-tetronate kinase n=1 Tax=Jannaschia sp. S6380 TaxID=2926408 RepID=UPI001FF0E74C|nr:3-oxo-tetronate kinase [Jannaschia sp. S6380]MCK0165977.1 four-carbon acid sugar kinase family protein [Jannaschia sp. S6380]
MSGTFFGAIADDFTGATDLAAMLSRAGVPVTLRIGVPKGPETATAFEVVALKIRTIPPEDAVAEARAALKWLRGQGARRIFWKYCSTFDSTPRGNIGPVADALMSDLDVDRTVHCPAFPENGRRVFMGNLFVGDQPLDESPMKDHPLTPMRDADLQRLLQPQVQRQTGLIAFPTVRAGAGAIRDAIARQAGHVVVDAVEDADLDVIAAAISDMELVCGGSAVARPLPALWAEAGELNRGENEPAPDVSPGRIVLSGSCSAMTRAQVGAYLDAGAIGYRLDPRDLAQDGVRDARAWLAAQDPEADKIVFATAEPKVVQAAQEALGVTRAGTLVEEAMAVLAQDARAMGIGRIVVAGGETSGAVTRALDVDRLRIGPEIAPGVPWCFAGNGSALALKSGNFGAATFFADAFSLLDKGAAVAAR